jgi:hypothetical protein
MPYRQRQQQAEVKVGRRIQYDVDDLPHLIDGENDRRQIKRRRRHR